MLDKLASPSALTSGEAPVANVVWGEPRPLDRAGRVTAREGSFTSPAASILRAGHRVTARWITPRDEPKAPCYVVLAASRDEGFDGRTALFLPLAERHGTSAVMLECPFYGSRRPPGQDGPNVGTVAEQLALSVAAVIEARAMLEHLAAQGILRLGVAGFSMGGSLAALVAATTSRPIASAIFAAGRSGVPVYTQGLLARSIDYATLGRSEGGAPGAKARFATLFAGGDVAAYPLPTRADAAVLVASRSDGYVLASEVEALHAHWPGSALTWLDTGHAGAWLFERAALRRAAVEAMSRLSAR